MAFRVRTATFARMPDRAPAPSSKDPLHGLRLDTLLERLVEAYGWAELARRVPIRCFEHEPSIGSSLKFLRRTPWARARVEGVYRGLVGRRGRV